MFIEEQGGTVVDTYAPTVCQDMAEKMTTTDETWAELERYGIENIKAFAQQQGVKRVITQKGLSEYEGRTLWQKYEKYNADSGNTRTDRRSLSQRGSQLKGSSGINSKKEGGTGSRSQGRTGQERQRQIIKDTPTGVSSSLLEKSEPKVIKEIEAPKAPSKSTPYYPVSENLANSGKACDI